MANRSFNAIANEGDADGGIADRLMRVLEADAAGDHVLRMEMPALDLLQASRQLRARIDAACAAWRGSEPGVRLSLSMGWAVPEWSESLASAFSRADRAMYEAKRSAAQPAS